MQTVGPDLRRTSCSAQRKQNDYEIRDRSCTKEKQPASLVPQTPSPLHPNVHPPSPPHVPATSLILFPNEAEGVCSHPEPGENLLLDVGFELVNQSHLLLVFSLHQEELDDAGGLVDIDPHGGCQGETDVHILPVVPDLVAGAGPASAPGAVVLPKTAGPLLTPAWGAFSNQPDHHPTIVVHLPVPAMAQQTLLTQHLGWGLAG